jgi:acetoin utilization protein AcuB
MIRDVVALEEARSVRDAILVFQKHHIRHLPILKDGRLVGIVTDRDLKRVMPSPLSGADQQTFERVVDSTTVGKVMTRNPYCVTPSTPLKDAVRVMQTRKFGALPVVEGERLVGILTVTDLLQDLYNLLPD